ncbi:MAG: hypothetical protein ACJ73D_00400 [Pyrinomonadaceae bacterium]
MGTIEKYSRVEYERRWLVRPAADWRQLVEPYSKHLHDRYIDHTRLRLRYLTNSDTGPQPCKLGKKYASRSPYKQPIVGIELSRDETSLLEALPARTITKRRYYFHRRDDIFSIDVFEEDLAGLVICEFEAESIDALMAVEPPDFLTVEVTNDIFFTGGSLCRITASELKEKLRSAL